MAVFTKSDSNEFMVRAIVATQLHIPFYASLVRAGFPSPAENYVERACDLNDLCIDNQEATFFVQAVGDSMIGDHIVEGDVLIVDCSREAVDGKIVVVWVNGGNAVKRIHYEGDLVVLVSSNEKYKPIRVQPGDGFKIYGVVTFVVHKAR